MPNVMAALLNIGGALCSTPQFGWRPLLECRAVTLPRRETRWNLQGCTKLTKRSQPLVGRSSPYCGDISRRYGCLTSFFPIVDTCLSSEDIAQQSCGIVPRWRLFGDFSRPVLSASRAQHVSDLHSKEEGKKTNRKGIQRQIIWISHMHTYTQCQNQQVNRRHIKISYLLTALEPAQGSNIPKVRWVVLYGFCSKFHTLSSTAKILNTG